MKKIHKYLSIHLTDVCNSACNFCVVDSPYVEVNSVTREKIDAFLKEHQNSDFKIVNLHGGEPTIRTDFLNILELINELGYESVILQTNGRSLGNKKFAKQTHDLKVKEYVVSMHGKDKETNTIITSSGKSFDQAINGIKNVIELGAKVRTNTVISKDNVGYVADIMDLLISLGVHHINISNLHTVGTAYRNFDAVTPYYTDAAEAIPLIVDRVTKAGLILTLEGFPYCVIKGYEHYALDWASEQFRMLYRNYVIDDYGAMMDEKNRVKGEPCKNCHRGDVCGGVYQEYIQHRGWNEIGYKAAAIGL